MSPRDVSTSARTQAALAALRDRGTRVTKARRAVIDVLDSTAEHLSADEIAARAADSVSGLNRATVYRALATLGELELVVHTHVAGSATVFHLDDPDHASGLHAHVRCSNCDTLIDVPVHFLEPLADRLREEIGFELEPRHAAMFGTCKACLSAGPER